MIGEAGFDEENQSVDFSIRPDLAFSKSTDGRDEDDNSHAAVPRLWQYCEDSHATVKLLLPDALHVPFYLPMQRKKHASVEQEMVREKRRLETLSMQSMSRISQRSAHIHIPDFGSKALDRRERMLESKLMDKYRKNPEKAAEIIKKYFETRRSRIKIKEEVINTPRRFSLHEGPLVSLATDRHERASIRRSTLISVELDKLKDKEEQWLERVQSVEEKASKVTSNPSGQRQREWILLVKALNKLRYMHMIVKNARDIKDKDTVS
ncbi:hypothetical protein EON65_23535 [archaeon]|nr:MAG: hypothetical protein EON65_23535 [archaeon]